MYLDKRDSSNAAQVLTTLLRSRATGGMDLSGVTPKDQGRLRSRLTALWLGMAFLVFMNLAGMYLNLWGDIPNYSSAAKAFGSVPILDAHVAIAIAILANISLTVVAATKPENKRLRPAVIAVVVFAALAVFSGVEFTFGGGNDVFSMTMEIGFAGLISATAYVLFVVGRQMNAPHT